LTPHVALEAIGVSKSFSTRDALYKVDLVARCGEVHGLLGPNGAGKTTLMRVLLGLVRRDAGRVRLLGRDIDWRDALPDGVAGLVDVPAFYPYLSGRRNLALLARLDGAKRAQSGAVEAVLDRTGLMRQADEAVAGYSAGMRQRLGLAAALLRSPALLLLDEPTSALDPAAASDVRALIRRMSNDGAAVVLSSHAMAEVEELCTRVSILDRGNVVFSGAIDELKSRAPAAVHAIRTSDDRAAYVVAGCCPGIRAMPATDEGFDVTADLEALDAYVIALGRTGIAVRALQRRARTLESLFLELTTDGARGQEVAPASGTPFDEPDWELAS
jgi:ABC-2 type transport system ATP-binding protein